MIFSISETGSSHLPKNVPCQDFSSHYESADGKIKLAIVCDGHGEACCCRSDRGSRFAAAACQTCVLPELESIGRLVAGKTKAVTVKPAESDLLWGRRETNPDSDIGRQLRAQAELYNIQQANPEIEKMMRLVFSNIREEWLRLIRCDVEQNEFCESEKAALGDRPLERAYGTTLMCYVQTPVFWMAFQVGDGRLLVANYVGEDSKGTKKYQWFPPVPWDCECFLNRTTSLCNDCAVEKFRYVYDGSGNFPAVALCCSDGVEDSFGDYEDAPQALHDFYTKLVNQLHINGVDKTLENLHQFLPELSSCRSHDDMSIAGVLN